MYNVQHEATLSKMTLVLWDMQVHYSIENLPVFKNAVITIGTFDGVHSGHKQIINQLNKEAAEVDGESVIITFHPHPRKVIGSKPLYLLNTLDEKIALLQLLQVNHLVVVPFTKEFSNQTPEEYVTDFLFDKFHPHTIIIGYDHKFGKGRKGDYHLLENYGKQLGFKVKEISEKIINEAIVSSTLIRKALLENDVETATVCLGYNYFFEGIIVDGNKLGRTLGYPTANIIINDEMKLIPANGIYIATAKLISKKEGSNDLLQGMLSIGVRPTINGSDRTIEMNIFNFDKDIYGETLKVFTHKYLRAEVKFNSLEDLKNQMDKDKQSSMNYFKNF